MAGIALFAFVLAGVDLGRALGLIASADPAYLFAGVLLVIVEVLVRSLNWMLLAGVYARGYGFAAALRTYMIGIAFGAVTPGKAGDLVKTKDLMDSTGLDLTKAVSVGLLDRVINLAVLVLSAVTASGLTALMVAGSSGGLTVVSAMLAAAVLAFAIALDERLSLMVLRPLQGFLVPRKLRSQTKQLFRAFHDTVSEFRASPTRYAVAATTVTGWLVIFCRPYLFGLALGMDVSWWAFVMFMPIVTAVEVLPLSVMGLGTRDATLVLLFGLMGVTMETMVALSAMILLVAVVPQVVAGYLLAMGARKKGAAKGGGR